MKHVEVQRCREKKRQPSLSSFVHGLGINNANTRTPDLLTAWDNVTDSCLHFRSRKDGQNDGKLSSRRIHKNTSVANRRPHCPGRVTLSHGLLQLRTCHPVGTGLRKWEASQKRTNLTDTPSQPSRRLRIRDTKKGRLNISPPTTSGFSYSQPKREISGQKR